MTDYKNSTDESRNFRHGRDDRKWTGIFILIIGVALLLRSSNLNFPHWIFSWQTFLIGLGLFIGIRHNFRDITWAILIAIGGFFLITDIFPEFDFIPKWPIILIIIGLFFILRPGRGRMNNWGNITSSPSDSASIDDTNYSSEDFVEGTSIFGGTKKNVLSKKFKGADLVNIFGGSELDMMQADFTGTAVIQLTTIFGGTKLLVPSNWNVRSEAITVFGGLDDKRKMPIVQESSDKTLLIRGTVLFGGVEIKAINKIIFMNWYLAKFVFRIFCGEGNHVAQFDEQLRLVAAADKIEAFTKAKQMGKHEEEIFLNNKQHPVQWKFINISELYKIGEMIDGAELHSSIRECDDAINYIDLVNRKAHDIIHSDSHELLQLV